MTATQSATVARQKAAGEHGKFGELGRTVERDTIVADAGETKFTKRYERLEDKVEMLKDELAVAIASLDSDTEWRRALDAMSQLHGYSFNNTLLIKVQNPDATICAGAKTWRSGFNRTIREDQRGKGLAILAPRMAWVTAKDAEGNDVLDENGKPKREFRVVGFTTTTTYDISQTEGDPMPELRPALSETPPDGLIDDLEAAITAKGYTVSYGKMPTAETRGYTTTDGRVVIRDDLGPADRAKTLAHELGHIQLGHIDRTGDYHTGPDGCRGEMEVEAESFAYVLSRLNGMSTDLSTNSSRYLNSWAAKGKTDADSLAATVDAMKKSGTAIAKGVNDVVKEQKFRNISTVIEQGKAKAAEAAAERRKERAAKKKATGKKTTTRKRAVSKTRGA